MIQRPVVAVTRRLPAAVEQELASRFDARLNQDDHPWSPDELRAALATADAVLCTVTDRIGPDVLDVDPCRARLLANFGVGFNHIDLVAAARRGVAVSNTPGVLTEATAELTLLLMLMVARRAGEGERLVRAGGWTGWAPTQLLGRSLSGRTLGIVGMGRIGRAVAQRAQAGLGMQVVYHTRSPLPPEVAPGARPMGSLEALLGAADVVSLHCPATAETRRLISRERLALMRPTAILVNTARGDVVDEAALADALAEGRLGGAGLDVYQDEPAVSARLRRLENVVLLPHLGSATEETRVAMGRRALNNLVAYFRGEPLPDPVLPAGASAPPRP